MMTPTASLRLAADPLLPQRDALLNTTAVTQWLATHLGGSAGDTVQSCEQRRVKYRVGESLRVLYQFSVHDHAYTVAARAFATGKSAAAYQKATAAATACDSLPSVLHDPVLETVFWRFPHDRKITTLSVLDAIPDSLSRQFRLPWVSSRLVAYAPEKSATAQCLSATGDILAYAKVYADDENARIVRNHCALKQSLPANDPYLRLPQVLAYSTPHRMLLIEPAVGQRFADLREPAFCTGLQRFGAAVARLHTLPPPPEVSRFIRLDLNHLSQAAALIGQIRPDVAEQAKDLADLLISRWQAPTGSLVCLHGDVHLKNGIVQKDVGTLIDLDQVAVGPAAAELGSFLASLRYWRCIGSLSPAAERQLRQAFLTGYAAVYSLPDRDVLRWYTTAALLAERGLRAVNRIRTLGLAHLSEILATAQALLTEKNDD